MALYRTVKASERLPDGESRRIICNCIYDGQRERFEVLWWDKQTGKFEEYYLFELKEWLEPIEPSPDIQKRAEELFPEDWGNALPTPKDLFNTDMTSASKDWNEVNRNKAIQLATEAVAAEREKYEKEIREMREILHEIDKSLYIGPDLQEEDVLKWYIDVVSVIKDQIKEQLQQRIK